MLFFKMSTTIQNRPQWEGLHPNVGPYKYILYCFKLCMAAQDRPQWGGLYNMVFIVVVFGNGYPGQTTAVGSSHTHTPNGSNALPPLIYFCHPRQQCHNVYFLFILSYDTNIFWSSALLIQNKHALHWSSNHSILCF